MSSPILSFFEYAHLPPALQAVSKPLGDLAKQLDEQLPDGPEKSAGLRKLLEAKDCFVRTMVVTPTQKFDDSKDPKQVVKADEPFTSGLG